jgi:hypothetical protein
MKQTSKRINRNTRELTRTLAGRVSQGLGALWGGHRPAPIVAFALLAGCTLFSTSAKASCGPSKAPKLAIVLPESQSFQARGATQQASSLYKPKGDANTLIVGLWHVKFVSNGQLYDEGFDQFHADGTEILNDDGVPPAEGNVCLGVFKKVGHLTYQLKHPAFVWDANGALVGTLVIRETITLKPGRNSYQGSFVFDFYDLTGNLTDEVTGDLTGERITVD